jgi:hypothetical protein
VAGLPGGKTPGLKVITVPLVASCKHWRKVPAPLSTGVVTTQAAAGSEPAAASADCVTAPGDGAPHATGVTATDHKMHNENRPQIMPNRARMMSPP